MWFEDELEDSGTRQKVENQSAHDEPLTLSERRYFDEQQVREQTIQAPSSGLLVNPNAPQHIEGVSMSNVKSQFPNLNLPSVSGLKSSFGKGKIPQEADFKHLIDMAAVGCTAMGIVPGSPPAQLGSGLGLTPDNKLMVSAPMMKGMIVMYYGTEKDIPQGWKLCDGLEGRPNLLDRFIVGGRVEDSGKATTESLKGSARNKSFSIKTKMAKVDQTLQVLGHQLNVDELPSHRHHSSIRYLEYSLDKVSDSVMNGVEDIKTKNLSKIYRIQSKWEYTHSTGNFYPRWTEDGYAVGDQPPFNPESQNYPYEINENFEHNDQRVAYDLTSFSGDNKAHSHDIVETGNGHDHDLDVEAPYAILAFIIKV